MQSRAGGGGGLRGSVLPSRTDEAYPRRASTFQKYRLDYAMVKRTCQSGRAAVPRQMLNILDVSVRFFQMRLALASAKLEESQLSSAMWVGLTPSVEGLHRTND